MCFVLDGNGWSVRIVNVIGEWQTVVPSNWSQWMESPNSLDNRHRVYPIVVLFVNGKQNTPMKNLSWGKSQECLHTPDWIECKSYLHWAEHDAHAIHPYDIWSVSVAVSIAFAFFSSHAALWPAFALNCPNCWRSMFSANNWHLVAYAAAIAMRLYLDHWKYRRLDVHWTWIWNCLKPLNRADSLVLYSVDCEPSREQLVCVRSAPLWSDRYVSSLEDVV